MDLRRRPAMLGGELALWWSWFFRRVKEGVVGGLVSFVVVVVVTIFIR